MEPIKRYTNLEDLLNKEPKAISAFKLTIGEDDDFEFDDFIQLIEFVFEYSHFPKQTVDSDYITTYYEVETDDGKWKLEIIGKSLRKDMSVCDEELSECMIITDLDELKNIKKYKKLSENEKNIKKWQEFFEGKSLEDLKNKLLTYSYK